MPTLPNKTTIRGYVFDAFGVPSQVGFAVRFTLAKFQAQNVFVLLPESREVAVNADGYFEVELFPTSNTNQLYIAEFLDATSQILASARFTVPQSATPLDLGTLFATTIDPNDIDTSVRRLAEFIRSQPQLLQLFAGGFNARGVYDSTAIYQYLDLVEFDGSSWVALRRVPFSGITPGTDPTFWQIVTERGDTGVGAGQGINTPYNQATWAADDVSPPTRQAIGNEVEVLRNLANSKVAANNPTLTGVVTIPTDPTIGNRAASTQFVENNYAKLNSPIFTGSPQAPSPTITNNSDRIATTQFVKNTLPFGIGLSGVFNSTLTNVAASATTQFNLTGAALQNGLTLPSASTIQFPVFSGIWLIVLDYSVTPVGGATWSDINRWGLQTSIDGGSTWSTLCTHYKGAGGVASSLAGQTTETQVINASGTGVTWRVRTNLSQGATTDQNIVGKIIQIARNFSVS
jgi:hypothetical protein